MGDKASLMGRGASYEDASTRDDGGDADLVEISGAIKWFDVAKGYGFVLPDDGTTGDMLLHVTCLQARRFPDGARRRARRLPRQARRARHAGLSRAVDGHVHRRASGRDAGAAHACRGVAESGLERALVKWFNRTKGFGFLTRGEGTEDIFVHMETLRRYGITELRPGQVVLVRFGRGDKGLMAAEIHPDMGTLPVSH